MSPEAVLMVKALSFTLCYLELSFEKCSTSTGFGRYFAWGSNNKRSGVETNISLANFWDSVLNGL